MRMRWTDDPDHDHRRVHGRHRGRHLPLSLARTTRIDDAIDALREEATPSARVWR
jgi:hypothetical protein